MFRLIRVFWLYGDLCKGVLNAKSAGSRNDFAKGNDMSEDHCNDEWDFVAIVTEVSLAGTSFIHFGGKGNGPVSQNQQSVISRVKEAEMVLRPNDPDNDLIDDRIEDRFGHNMRLSYVRKPVDEADKRDKEEQTY
jgi:hypothetical protein